MSKDDDLDDEDDILPEYDFSNGVRGMFYRPGRSIIRMTIDEDVARHFWSSELINNALHQLIAEGRAPEGSPDQRSTRDTLRKEVLHG